MAESKICISKFFLGGIREYQKLASEKIWKVLFSEIRAQSTAASCPVALSQRLAARCFPARAAGRAV
ncbi:MAG: hypothetical protein ABSE69_05845 [Roseiarcus sp.]